MNLEIKKDLASNWFKMLQDAIWHTIVNLEKKDANIKTTIWNRSEKRDEGGGEFRILEKGKIFEKNEGKSQDRRLVLEEQTAQILLTNSGPISFCFINS